MNIFPQIEFTASELVEIHRAITSPVIVKYLHTLAHSIGTDICASQRKDGESAESYLTRLEHVKGGLGVIETLLQIGVDNPPLPVPASSTDPK